MNNDDDIGAARRAAAQTEAQQAARQAQEAFPPVIADLLVHELHHGSRFHWLYGTRRWRNLLTEIREAHQRATEAVAA